MQLHSFVSQHLYVDHFSMYSEQHFCLSVLHSLVETVGCIIQEAGILLCHLYGMVDICDDWYSEPVRPEDTVAIIMSANC